MAKNILLKLKYSEIEKMSEKELLETKRKIEYALKHHGMWSLKREKGLSPSEAKKNIARINQRLNELEKEKQ